MEVLFASAKLQKVCSSQRQLAREWGTKGAKKIGLRLQQLAAAVTLEDMRNVPGRCHELGGSRKGQLAIDVHQPYRMMFKPTPNPPPTTADGGLDWQEVDSITVTEIVDYH